MHTKEQGSGYWQGEQPACIHREDTVHVTGRHWSQVELLQVGRMAGMLEGVLPAYWMWRPR